MDGQPLAGKVALVTGATRGVGRGIARGLGEAGATVYVTGRSTDGSDFNPGAFWEQPLSLWDSMHRIGVRANYVTSALAAPLMIKSGAGLIVNVSSFAGQVFVPPVPYGVAHAAIDRLARDMAEDLRPHQITSISLYPGLVLTQG